MATSDISKLSIDRTNPLTRKPKWYRRKFGWIIALVLLAAALFSARSKFSGVTEVETAAVSTSYPSQGFTLLNATGFVVAQRKASVATKATGRLEWLGVREGSVVKSGEVIARLENRDVNATQDQAAANINVAKANLEQGLAELKDAEQAFKRSQELLDKNFISAASHDSAVARLNKAKATINSLRAGIAAAGAGNRVAQVSVEQTLIRAPFDGVVLTKNANVGDIVTPFSSAAGTTGAVVTMADMSTLEVEADVSEGNLAKIKVGQPCEILLEAFPDTRYAGSVVRTVPTVDRSKATVLVKVKFNEPDARILPEMSAKVAFLSRETKADERKAVTVARKETLAQRDGKNVVFVANNDKVKQVVVEKGNAIGELIEVKGVDVGDKLVINPPEKLADGASVKLAKK
ncbi:MAG: efflux RND transporter periplasmic adaptor subunit [Burkholderiales bacterium]